MEEVSAEAEGLVGLVGEEDLGEEEGARAGEGGGFSHTTKRPLRFEFTVSA